MTLLEENLIYIVSGVARSGTSMMLQALQSGGMDVAFHPSRDGMNKIVKLGRQAYIINPNGFFEFLPDFYKRADFPKGHEGKVVKCLFPRILQIPKGNYKIILMIRDVQEILGSWHISFDGVQPKDLGINMSIYDQMMVEGKEVLETVGAEVIVLRYEEVLKRPKKYFQELKDMGWPINVIKAISVIDPKLHRIKRNENE